MKARDPKSEYKQSVRPADFVLEKDKEQWHGNEINVQSDPLKDYGGRPYILRQFTFGINPGVKHTPTKQELFNHHLKQIEITLWTDGLKPVLDIPPRVSVKQRTYTIFVLAEPIKLGYHDKLNPQKLEDILNPRV